MAAPIKYIFLELTNHCNFDCTFCPNEAMTRPRVFMDKALAFRMVDEIAEKNLTKEPLQLHLMGEPFLVAYLFEIIETIHEKGLHVRLFTNGSHLNRQNIKRLFAAGIEELTVGIHTFTPELFLEQRRGKIPFDSYMARIRDTIEAKFEKGSKTRIYLQYLNTKHFNRARLDKNYPGCRIPLVDTEEKAKRVIDEWKVFGRSVSGKYGLGFEPRDLECLQGEYRERPLDCLRGDHCEILPGVILSFKDISSFSDFLTKKVRYVERFKADCRSFDEQLAVLADGSVTPCCVDYDGQLRVGNARRKSLLSIWKSGKLRLWREESRAGFLPTPACRICKAIIAEDDYSRKFGGTEEEPYELISGWYNLENDGVSSFRWTGKRAILTLKIDGKVIVFEVKNGNPNVPRIRLMVSQGKRKEAYRVEGDAWKTVAFKLKNIKKSGCDLALESDVFWIPAESQQESGDQRELGILVRSVHVERKFNNSTCLL